MTQATTPTKKPFTPHQPTGSMENRPLRGSNAYLIQRDWQGNHSAKPAITGWKELGFTPRRERYDGGRQAQSGRMTGIFSVDFRRDHPQILSFGRKASKQSISIHTSNVGTRRLF